MQHQLIHKAVRLRTLAKADAEILAGLANDKTIWNNVRDHFPYPYTIEHAKHFISESSSENPPVTFAIDYNQKLVGVIGIKRQPDIYRRSGEIGYWIGSSYRRRGIATTALELITNYGINTLVINRLYAGVFSNNIASIKVLEKCGYLHEGISKKAVWKNGQFVDEHRFAIIQTDDPRTNP